MINVDKKEKIDCHVACALSDFRDGIGVTSECHHTGWVRLRSHGALPKILLAMTHSCHPELVSGSHNFAPSPLVGEGLRERCRLTRGAAFTLAEVLITLGIIGIVAAMTLPTLIQKHQERVTVNKVKKFYSVMSQAQLLAIKDNGYMDEWDFGNGNSQATILKVMSYFKPYLKISKDCGTQSGCLGNGTIKLLSGEDWGAYDNNSSYYKLILNDGTYMWASTGGYAKCVEQNISCMAIWIDVNGAKPPNTMGRDVFQFSMRKNAVIASTGINGTVESTSGFDSALYILRYGNMDYLKK